MLYEFLDTNEYVQHGCYITNITSMLKNSDNFGCIHVFLQANHILFQTRSLDWFYIYNLKA